MNTALHGECISCDKERGDNGFLCEACADNMAKEYLVEEGGDKLK